MAVAGTGALHDQLRAARLAGSHFDPFVMKTHVRAITTKGVTHQ